jgi:hypothetical protein
MAKQDIDYLKGKFSDDQIPTSTDFADLIDSTVTSANSGEFVSLISNSTITGNLSVRNVLSADGGFISDSLSGLTTSLDIIFALENPAEEVVGKQWRFEWTNGILTGSGLAPSAPASPSVTPTATVTPSVTPSITVTPTVTPSSTVTPTVTPSVTVTPTVTPSTTSSS